MPDLAIKYDPREAGLVVTGFGHLFTEGNGAFVAPISIVEDLTLTELKHALHRWAEDNGQDDPRLLVSDDPPEHFGEHSVVRPDDVGLEAGALVIRASIFSVDEPPARKKLIGPLQPLLRRRRAVVTRVTIDAMPGYWVVSVSLAWRRPGARIRDALNLADDVDALLGAGIGGAITLPIALDLVRASRSDLLIGMRESEWLEVKSAPYRLEQNTQEIELAKDVAAMANAGGGMILLGVKAKKLPEYEEIRTINGCRLADVSPRRYRDLIRRRVYPSVRDFDVELVAGTEAGEGVALLSIPPQDDGHKPFIVHGAVVGDKVLGAFVGIPHRVGEDTAFVDPRTLHARLRAGEQALGATDDSVIADMRAQLVDARDATAPAWLRTVIAAARHDGIEVEHGQGSVVFRAPDQDMVEVSTDPGGPLVDEFHRQNLVAQLVPLGLRTRHGPRGQIIPAFVG